MRALMGDKAKKIRLDSDGREALRAFIIQKGSDTTTITLQDGKKFIVSRNKLKSAKNAA